MKITEARMEIDGGNVAVYMDAAADLPVLPDGPFVAISVVDFEEAKEVVATIDRSRAQKRREKKPEPEKVTPPAEGAAKARALGEKLSEITG